MCEDSWHRWARCVPGAVPNAAPVLTHATLTSSPADAGPEDQGAVTCSAVSQAAKLPAGLGPSLSDLMTKPVPFNTVLNVLVKGGYLINVEE